jgi:chaperone modulatory protein CbpM
VAFSEADLARAELIRDLMQDLGVNDEGVGVILNLLDQMHGLRRALAGTLQSVRQRSALPDT